MLKAHNIRPQFRINFTPFRHDNRHRLSHFLSHRPKMTSSLRNSLHRPTHKERSQLAHRLKYGILEKHADYVKRARDYHSKRNHLTRLKQKAAERNKDEFYFSMVKEKTRVRMHASME